MTKPVKLSEAQRRAVAFQNLLRAVEDYLSEMDNASPDYAYRKVLRDHLRKATAAGRAALENGNG